MLVLCYAHRSFAQEGNYRLENYGNNSALLTGNVTASVSDLALSYYNPSRLAFLGESKFLISIKAYQYEQFAYKNSSGPIEKVSDSDFNGIPSMLAGKFQLSFLPNHTFAYSLVSRQRINRNLTYESGLLEDGDFGEILDPQASLINLDMRTRIKDEWMGLSWAHKLKDHFSVGATAFFSIYEYRETGDLLMAVQREDNSVVMQNNRVSYKQNTYGLFFKLGASYLLNDIELGANISLPHLKVFGDASFLAQDLSSGLGPEMDNFMVYEAKDLENSRKTNLGIALGAGIPWGKSKIHTTLEWYSPVKDYERITLPDEYSNPEREGFQFNEAYRSIINFGVGADLFLSPNTRLIMSASSDFNAQLTSINLLDKLNQIEGDDNIFGNIWHFGLGTDLNTKLGNIYTGIIYSYTFTRLDGSDTSFPGDTDPMEQNPTAKVNYQRFRIILGIDLALIEQKLEEKLEQITAPGEK